MTTHATATHEAADLPEVRRHARLAAANVTALPTTMSLTLAYVLYAWASHGEASPPPRHQLLLVAWLTVAVCGAVMLNAATRRAAASVRTLREGDLARHSREVRLEVTNRYYRTRPEAQRNHERLATAASQAARASELSLAAWRRR